MAGKVKKTPSRRGQEKLNRALRRFDLATLGVVGLILLSCLSCWNARYHLGGSSAAGFVYWFLVVISYPVLIAGHLILDAAGIPTDFIAGREAPVLSGAALLFVVAVWGVTRSILKRRGDVNTLRVAGNFMLIFFAWGLFQIACGATMKAWHGSETFNLIHRK